MLFSGKRREKTPDQPQEEKSLYPVVYVTNSLKEYQKWPLFLS